MPLSSAHRLAVTEDRFKKSRTKSDVVTFCPAGMRKENKSPRLDGFGVPPYLSFRTFTGFVERLRKSVPNRIDRSVLSSFSGSNQSQILAALRYLELISPKGVPSEKLSSLVESEGTEFRKNLRQVLVGSYPFLFKGFDLRRATVDELIERFEGAGATGDTIRKSVSFFLAAAKHAELEVSPFMLNRRRARRPYAGSRAAKAVGVSLPDAGPNRTWQELALSKLPEFDTAWSPEVKSKWFDAFDRLIESMESANKGGNRGSA